MSERQKPPINNLKQEYVDKMGPERGAAFYALYCEWAEGLERYKEFKELFGTKKRVDLLNILGKGFFWDIQRVLLDDLILRLARLTDPSKGSLSVHRLPRLLNDETVRTRVMSHIGNAVRAAKAAKDWRNRRIAHRDWSLVVDPNAKPLAMMNLEAAKRVLDSVHAALDATQSHCTGEGFLNDVSYPPRTRGFVAHLDQLVKSVQYIDSIIDPGGRAALTDLGVSQAFLRRVGGSGLDGTCQRF